MTDEQALAREPPPLGLQILVPVVAWAIGIFLVFGPIIRSRFELIFAGLGDVRLVNYSLEHSYRWLSGYPLHTDLWSPPLFYPYANVAAFTDLLVGVASPYWILRAADWDPEPAYIGWMLTIWTLNFVAAYLLVRRGFGVGILGSGLGAFLFSFATSRAANIVHQQLVPSFFLLVGVGAIIVVFGPGTASRRRRTAWIAAFFAAMVLQAYTAIYALYFFSMGVGAALVGSLAMSESRQRVLESLRRDGVAIGLAAILALVAVAPLVLHYGVTAREVGMRGYPYGLLPRPASWLLPGQNHPWYGWLQQRDGPFFALRASNHSNGVGPITTALALVGLYSARRRRGVRYVASVVAVLAVVSTVFPGGFTFWRYVYDYLPGAAGLRAVGRIGMVLLLPASLGVAFLVDRLAGQSRYHLLALLAIVVVAEQKHDIRYRPRAPVDRYLATLAERLDSGCEAFFLAYRGRSPYPHVHDDAAWIGLRTRIPTINGRYGNFPPGYGLRRPQIRNPADREAVRGALDRWIEEKGLPGRRVCWIETRGYP